MLKKGTLVVVDDQFIAGMAYALRMANGSITDSRTRIQRNSMMEAVYSGDYEGYFKVVVSEEIENSVTILDGFDPQNEFAGWAYYNAKPVHCRRGSISAKTGFLCLNIEDNLNVSYTIEDTVPEIPIINEGVSETSVAGKKVLAYITVSEANISIRQIFQYDIPEIKVWCNCEEEE